jgi:conjugal transfer pilin signal peptidase TrbI
VQRGDIILFDPPASPLLVKHFGAKPKPFGKRVSGVPGDIITEQTASTSSTGGRGQGQA